MPNMPRLPIMHQCMEQAALEEREGDEPKVPTGKWADDGRSDAGLK